MVGNLPLVPGALARLIEKWASKRSPEPSHSVTLVRQRIYILPTGYGVVFFIILLVILAGAINYENSLGYMLTFLLSGTGFLGMIQTHQNLNHINLQQLSVNPVFCGQVAYFPVQITAGDNKSHFNIKFQSSSDETVNSYIETPEDNIVEIPTLTSKRGIQTPGKIKVFTEFPLGLFHAWSWVELNSHCLVYPDPEPHPLTYIY